MKKVTTKNLINARKIKKLTQQEVADYLGIARQTYSKLEKSEVDLTISQITLLSDFLSVDIGLFFNVQNNIEHKITKVKEEYSIDIGEVGFTLTHNLEAPEYWQVQFDIPECNRTLEEHIEAFEGLILELKKL